METGQLDQYIGKCLVLIIWPFPNNTTYDLEAIKRMRPLGFFTTYAPCGAAGGYRFIEYLKNPEPYQLLSQFTYIIGSGEGFSGKTFRAMALFHGQHRPLDFQKPKIEEKRQETYEDEGDIPCALM